MSEPLKKCPECGHTKWDGPKSCSTCVLMHQRIEVPMKAWIADYYRMKGASQ